MGIDVNNLKALFGAQPKLKVSTDEAEGKKEVKDVPVGQRPVDTESSQVGLDTFVRTTEVAQTTGAETLAVYNKANIKRNENAPQVNISPAATEARLTAALAAKVPEIAEEADVPVLATVNGLAPELLAGIEQNASYAPFMNKMLAQYLNVADAGRIEKAAHYAEIEQYA